jgi:glycosyltransferase involved in cell wall biosynthesis
MLLASLAEQRFSDFEVIIVDDDSKEPALDLKHGMDPDRVRYVRTEGVGAVEARCLGVKAATGDVLAFTDDDCVVDRDWLKNGVAAIDEGADVVQGKTLPQRELMPLERTVVHGADDGLFPTCNVFYGRVAYERAGGFDRFAADRLGFRPGEHARGLGFGEDTLLGWAVARAGRCASVPEAIVRHEVARSSLRDLFSRAWMAGAFPALVREVPELRRTLIKKRVVLGNPDARLSVYGLGLLLVGPLQIFGIATAMWWVAARARRLMKRPGPLAQRLLAVPVELALDVTTSVALLVGSARARTPVI